jgi:hypothetical protein
MTPARKAKVEAVAELYVALLTRHVRDRFEGMGAELAAHETMRRLYAHRALQRNGVDLAPLAARVVRSVSNQGKENEQ